jgi:hypothetical protein
MPPASSSDSVIRKLLGEWKGLVTAVDFTDNPSPRSRITCSAVDLCSLDMGLEMVFLLATRSQRHLASGPRTECPAKV